MIYKLCDLKNAAISINLTRNIVKKIIGSMINLVFPHGQAIYTKLMAKFTVM